MPYEDTAQRFANMPGVAYSGTEPFVFVSYCHKDWRQVYPTISSLIDEGYRVWYDDGIQGGDDWRSVIQDRVERCEVFLPFVTQGYCESSGCQSEVSVADEDQKRIIPLFVDKSKLTHGLRLLLPRKQGICKYEMPSEYIFHDRLCGLLPTCVRTEPAYRKDHPDMSQAQEGNIYARKCSDQAQRELATGRMYYWAGRKHAGNAGGRQFELVLAANLYQQSHELGDPYGTCELGRCYREGAGVPRDEKRAFDLAQDAANRADYGGNYDMGTYYATGIGTEKDHRIAAQYFEAASDCEPITNGQKVVALLGAIDSYIRVKDFEAASKLTKIVKQIAECAKYEALLTMTEKYAQLS